VALVTVAGGALARAVGGERDRPHLSRGITALAVFPWMLATKNPMLPPTTSDEALQNHVGTLSRIVTSHMD
jgi:hypothetical protein